MNYRDILVVVGVIRLGWGLTEYKVMEKTESQILSNIEISMGKQRGGGN